MATKKKDREPKESAGELTVIAGFEFDQGTANLILASDEALWILLHLQRNGCVEIEVDGGEHVGLQLLVKLAGEYWEVTKQFETYFFVVHDRFRIPSMP